MAKIYNEALIKAIGLKVRQLRSEKGISQEQLSYRSDISRSQIQRIENGEINTSVSHLDAISKALNVSLCKLVE